MSDDDDLSRRDSKNIDPRRYRPGFASRGLGPPIPPADDILVGVPIPSDKKEKEYVILPNGILALCGKTEHDIPIELKDQAVKQIYSTSGAFAALLRGWWPSGVRGDILVMEETAVRSKVRSGGMGCSRFTRMIAAFAALLEEWCPSGDVGRVLRWGGDSSAVQGELKDARRAADLLDWGCFCGSC